MRPQTGDHLGGRYRLTGRIATGGMGEVWRARDEVLARDVAVKILKAEYTGDAGFLDRFRAEARHTAALSHPHIAAVYDYGEEDHSVYLVMELVPGEPLSDVLAERGPLPPAEAAALMAQAADGLAAAHAAGLVHRDVKPGNLLVLPDGRVKVTDFGIARAGDQVPLTKTGQVMGTAQYLAPEQAMGRPATAASDVYALGVVTYEVLAGRRPFTGESQVALAMAHVHQDPPPLPDDVTGAVRDLVAAAMAKDPQQRPGDATAFAEAARAVARGDDDAARGVLGAVGGGGPAAGAGAAGGTALDVGATQVMPTGAGGAAARSTAGTRGTSTAVGSGALAAGAGSGAAGTDGSPSGADAAGGSSRRRVGAPLVALLALLVLVTIGAVLANTGVVLDGGSTPGPTVTQPGSGATTDPADSGGGGGTVGDTSGDTGGDTSGDTGGDTSGNDDTGTGDDTSGNDDPALDPGEGGDPAPDPGEGGDPAPDPGEGGDPAPDPGEGGDPAPDPGEGADPAPDPGEGADPGAGNSGDNNGGNSNNGDGNNAGGNSGSNPGGNSGSNPGGNSGSNPGGNGNGSAAGDLPGTGAEPGGDDTGADA